MINTVVLTIPDQKIVFYNFNYLNIKKILKLWETMAFLSMG
ncbi:hypothetical protein [Okeania sp. SIO3I5]|nr:hypothetical protein [Okeania sp. SIO3I5]